MTVATLIALLLREPPSAMVVLARDADPGGFRILHSSSLGYYYHHGRTYGEFYEADQGQDELAQDTDYIQAVCLWPEDERIWRS